MAFLSVKETDSVSPCFIHIFLLGLFLAGGCGGGDKAVSLQDAGGQVTEQAAQLDVQDEKIPEKGFYVQLQFNKEIGWGYVIYSDGKAYVNQPHIPAVNGLQGFVSEEDAQKVAELMVYKIENKILPPSITLTELDSMNIRHQ